LRFSYALHSYRDYMKKRKKKKVGKVATHDYYECRPEFATISTLSIRLLIL
jgi:hypothetical protein